MRLFELLAMFHNWVSDKDFIWWPFSFLRPEPNEEISFKLATLMAACFGGLTFLFFMVFSVLNNVFTVTSMTVTLIVCFLGFFLWFNLITRPFWNFRARKLQKK